MARNDMLDDPTPSSMMASKFQNNPFLGFGCAGFLITAAIGIYKFKSRPKNMSVGSYLVQLRVIAQSVVVGSLTVGMAYGMLNEYVLKKKKD